MTMMIIIVGVLFNKVLSISHQEVQKQMHEVTTDFDPEYAQKLFYYTKIAVCGEQLIETWDCGFFCNMHPQMTSVKVFQNDSDSTLGYAGYDLQEQRIIVAFRSTQNIQNFLSDLKFLKVDYSCENCQVHRGFYENYQDLQESFLQHIDYLSQQYKDASLTVLGHSLGAAIATFAAIDLQLKGYHVKTFYIFGSPRVGNKSFRDYFLNIVQTKQRARITYYQDIVPHLPPMNLEYHHVVQEYWFDTDKHFIECDQTCEDPGCSSSIWKTSFSDHQTYFGINYKCGDEHYQQISAKNIIV